MRSVPDLLNSAAELYRERNKMYGDNYKRFGEIMHLLFPNGLTLSSSEAQNRFGIFVQVTSKLTRYAELFAKAGQSEKIDKTLADCLDDTSVYSMMLRELDNESKQMEMDLSAGVDPVAEVERMRGTR